MKLNNYLLPIALLFGTSVQLWAGNPIVDSIGLCDPHAVVFDDKVFIYATHDFSKNNTVFLMKDWWVWSSSDLVSWKHEGTLLPEQTFIGKPFNECWATFGVRKNNKYFWYFSAGPRQIGVVVGDTPAGPWKDPLGKPLLAEGLTPTEQRDPDVFIDDDNNAYMVYGTFDYFIVKLGDDMISLAETPRPVALDRKFGPYGEGRTDDKPSLHKHNDIYYLSWSSFYATSSNVYGPYTYKGTVIDPNRISPPFRTKDLFHDRHGNFFSFNNQTYFITNDKTQPGTSGVFRDSILCYVHYRANGEMAPIRIDRLGVGQYDATQPVIEAEEYFRAKKADKRESPVGIGDFEMRDLANGSELYYPNIQNLPANAVISFSVSSAHAKGGIIEVHEAKPTGKLLGSCRISGTGGWSVYKNVSCQLGNQAGKMDICLVFKGAEEEFCRLSSFGFSSLTK